MIQSTFLLNQIVQSIISQNIPFEILHHPQSRTSLDSANLRNTPLQWGAKTMLVLAHNSYAQQLKQKLHYPPFKEQLNQQKNISSKFQSSHHQAQKAQQIQHHNKQQQQQQHNKQQSGQNNNNQQQLQISKQKQFQQSQKQSYSQQSKKNQQSQWIKKNQQFQERQQNYKQIQIQKQHKKSNQEKQHLKKSKTFIQKKQSKKQTASNKISKATVVMLVYRANKKVSWKKVRHLLGNKTRMCNQEDVIALGLIPGGIAPFPEIVGLPGILDSSFMNVETMAFNAGSKTKSIVMKTKDFRQKEFAIQDITEEQC